MKKYIILPVALAIYCAVMAVLGFKKNGATFLTDNWVTILAEIAVIIALFFVLRYQYRKRNGE